MELVCPSCKARYGVPAGAIGARGRQVSCSNCGHGWHALPDGAEIAAVDEARHEGGARREENGGGNVATADVHPLRQPEPSRRAQLAEIRDMIAQVQSDDAPATAGRGDRQTAESHQGRESVPSGAPPAGAVPLAPATTLRSEQRRVDAVEGAPLPEDPLRRRMAEHDARAARERHDRLRERLQDRGDEPRAGSGPFLAGFLLVVLIGAAMLAAYLLDEEIVARVPESEPVLVGYVDAMDDLRIAIADGYERARSWVVGTIGGPA